MFDFQNYKTNNYVRVAQPDNDYWVDFSRTKLSDFYIHNFGLNFNIILYSQVDLESNFYIIPFKAINGLFKEEYLAKDKLRTDSSRRWIVTVRNHVFRVTNCPQSVDVKDYYSNRYWINYNDSADQDVDYSVEDKLQEVKVRLKQSKFRKDVLNNFGSSCCISNICEEDLLVASHIVPWGHKKESRLDPTNGLCLSVLHDKLFDKGYFTVREDLTIEITTQTENLSRELVFILNQIQNKKLCMPKISIKLSYLKYHRENVFIDRVK